jgi:hypothetical protein
MGGSEPTEIRRSKVLFVCSAGGHLAQMLQLEPWYRSYDVTWVTFRLPDAVGALEGERTVWGFHPTTRNIRNLIRNTWLAARVIASGRPDLIVSSGAGIAVPFFWIGKLFRAKTVYVEVIDRFDTRTMTARLVSPVTDLFVAQIPSQLHLFRGSYLIGRLL